MLPLRDITILVKHRRLAGLSTFSMDWSKQAGIFSDLLREPYREYKSPYSILWPYPNLANCDSKEPVADFTDRESTDSIGGHPMNVHTIRPSSKVEFL